MMKRVPVTVYFLQMTHPDQFRAVATTTTDFDLRYCATPTPEFGRFLYTSVGVQWYWLDRLKWSYNQWQYRLEQPTVHTWVLYHSGTPAGYFELEQQANGNVQISYFGLLQQFTGQGLGGRLLSAAVEQAWSLAATRIKLNTCSLDHPAALKNYQARGFRVYRELTEHRMLPEQPLGSWPGFWSPVDGEC